MIRCCGWGAGCAVEEALEVGAPRAAIIILVKKEHSAPRARARRAAQQQHRMHCFERMRTRFSASPA